MNNIYITNILINSLGQDGAEELKTEFNFWIQPNNEYKSKMFGKDVPFIKPKLDIGFLKHVHFVPFDKLSNEYRQWLKYFNLGKRKTSDRFLIYAAKDILNSPTSKYLLISIINNAHNYIDTNMSDLIRFAYIAENFIEHDQIIA